MSLNYAIDPDDYVDHDRPRYSEAVQVSTLITLSLREKLRNRARKSGQGLQDYLRSIIVRDLGLADDHLPSDVEPMAKEVIVVPIAAEPTPVKAADNVIDMVARGFSVQQIAAIKRLPYRVVMHELGSAIDRAVMVGKK